MRRYYFGDIEWQANHLEAVLPLDKAAEAVNKMVQRVARYYNLDNKYNGRGERQNDNS